MKVAVIGSGISGISAAEYLSDKCDVTIYEKNDRVGGHADTHRINVGDKEIDVDTGFIVFNPDNYPRFFQLLKKYEVSYKDSDMSFAVSNQFTGLEYNATNINKLFCQRKNLFNPKFYRMIKDIMRFYREASELLKEDSSDISLGQYLKEKNYSEYFINEHIIPMASALWSGKADLIMDFPAKYLVAFMQNHNMMQIDNRPTWKTVEGGSKQYLKAITEKADFKVRLNTTIRTVVRASQRVTIALDDGAEEHYDKVIMACHSDQALMLLDKTTDLEEAVLGAIKYQKNDVCLHSDTSLLPRNKKAWASWNVIRNEVSKEQCTVSYYMNLLQSLPTSTPVIVSLNMNEQVDTDKVWKYLQYEHPVYTQDTIDAQNQKGNIQGKHQTYYCGAYWGWGFHEDGARSGLEAAKQLLRDSGYAE